MQNKKVKIVYFSLHDSQAKEFELTWARFYSLMMTVVVILCLLITGSIALFTDFYHNLENSSLSKLNAHLQQQVDDLGATIVSFETRIAQLEQNDNDLRVIADLPKLDDDYRNVGVGGGQNNIAPDFAFVSNEAVEQVHEYRDALESMERRIELTLNSHQQIKQKLQDNKNVMQHTPSIRPVIDGTLRDKFGKRLHPLLNKIRHHYGVDFAAERGTEVYATAAGVVERVVVNKRTGFGKHVVINHGFGIKTLYGHLSKVFVRQGQKIDRWKPIGLVGSTGLSTGPHLHYEVQKQGRPIDPMTYILN